MKKYIILLALFIIGCNNNPKFHYNDRVKVSNGFFSCNEGTIITLLTNDYLFSKDYTYTIDHLKDEVNSEVSINVKEKNLSILLNNSSCGVKR